MNPQDLDDRDPRPDDADELISAVLDGEATPEQRRRVLGDPALAARLARFRAVAAAVATPVEVDPGERERAIGAALAAFEPAVDVEAQAAREAGGTDLPRPRRAGLPRLRRDRRPLVSRWVLASAAVVVVVLGAVVAGRLSSRPTDPAETASSPPSTLTPSSPPAADDPNVAEHAPSRERPDPAGARSAPAPGDGTSDPVAIGEVDSLDTLAVRVRALLDPGPSAAADTSAASPPAGPGQPVTEPAPGSGPDPCESRLPPTEAGLGDRTLVARAVLEGRTVVVYVLPTAGGGVDMLVVDPDRCTVTTRRPL